MMRNNSNSQDFYVINIFIFMMYILITNIIIYGCLCGLYLILFESECGCLSDMSFGKYVGHLVSVRWKRTVRQTCYKLCGHFDFRFWLQKNVSEVESRMNLQSIWSRLSCRCRPKLRSRKY